MNYSFLDLLCVFAASLVLVSCNDGLPKNFVEEADDPSEDIVATFDYGKMAALGHPRILMTADDFKELRLRVGRKAKENKILVEANELVISLADEYVEKDETIVYKLDAAGKRLLSQSRNALKRLFTISYAYKVTGDKKYYDAVEKDLRDVCGFKDWHPSHFLDTAEMSLAVAIAYDWLYYDLPLDLRELIHKCLVEYGMKASANTTYRHTVGNWNQVCNAGMIAAALAVYEKDKEISSSIIEDAVANNLPAMKGIYSPDGNYAEGYGYWHYGTGFQTILMKMLQTAFGTTLELANVEGFMNTADYILFMATPTGKSFSYADGGTTKERVLTGVWWFAVERNDESLAINEIRHLRDGLYASTRDRLTAALPCFILRSGFTGDSKETPAPKVWSGNGKVPVAMVRTGWNYDEGDRYLGIKGGAANGGHGHMDAGSFVYEAKGVRWSDDLFRPDYAPLEIALSNAGGNFWDSKQTGMRWDIYRMNNIAHSALAFTKVDGSIKNKLHVTDQIYDGKALIEEVFDSAEGYGAKLDVSATYADAVASAHRSFKVTEDALVITDEITAKATMPAPMQWRMMTPSTIEISVAGETLTQNGKSLSLVATASDPSVSINYTTWEPNRPQSWIKRDWDPENPGYMVAGYTATIPAGKTVTFTTILK